jgi:predicted hydrolase (HD superfamily)
MAVRAGEDPEEWGTVGLVHDFDYERFPNAAHAADAEHPSEGVRILGGLGAPESWQRAILGHAAYTGVPRESPMARALCALVRPSRSLLDLEPKSVRKKLKDKAFARGVSRDDVFLGAEELGMPLDDLIQFVLEALRPHETVLGLGAPG